MTKLSRVKSKLHRVLVSYMRVRGRELPASRHETLVRRYRLQSTNEARLNQFGAEIAKYTPQEIFAFFAFCADKLPSLNKVQIAYGLGQQLYTRDFDRLRALKLYCYEQDIDTKLPELLATVVFFEAKYLSENALRKEIIVHSLRLMKRDDLAAVMTEQMVNASGTIWRISQDQREDPEREWLFEEEEIDAAHFARKALDPVFLAHINRVHRLKPTATGAFGDVLGSFDYATLLQFLKVSAPIFDTGFAHSLAFNACKKIMREDSAKLVRMARHLAEHDGAPVYASVFVYFETRLLTRKIAICLVERNLNFLKKPEIYDVLSEFLRIKLISVSAWVQRRNDNIEGAYKVFKTEGGWPAAERDVLDDEAILTYVDDKEEAITLLEHRFAEFGTERSSINTLYASLLQDVGRTADARVFIETCLAETPDFMPNAQFEYMMTLYNLALDDDQTRAGQLITDAFAIHDLPFAFEPGAFTLETIAQSETATHSYEDQLVSVIMTAFNSSDYIRTSIESVLNQSHKNLELFVVDDCSSDDTAKVVGEIAQKDPRVRYLKTTKNSGTYVAKNSAIKLAEGAFITFHDSDDWWHPLHLAEHLHVMNEQPELVFNTSSWFRIDENGKAQMMQGGNVVYENPASTFVRRHVFEDVGRFDEVRIGADREFFWRVAHTYGDDKHVMIRKPLCIGRFHTSSLTQSGAGKLNARNFSQVRVDYWNAWNAWQEAHLAQGKPMFMPADDGSDTFKRPYEVPQSIYP